MYQGYIKGLIVEIVEGEKKVYINSFDDQLELPIAKQNIQEEK